MELAGYLAEAFQLGYVSRSLAAGVAHFKKTLGVESFVELEPNTLCTYKGVQTPFRIKVALANIGDRQLEIIEPIEGVLDFYNDCLENASSDVVLHHIGILVEGPEDKWQAMAKDVQEAGYDLEVQDKAPPGVVRTSHFAYIDTRPLLGHRLEFLWRGPESQRWHDSLPNQMARSA